MFKAIKQVAMRDNVSGFVNGATSDYVFYRLVKRLMTMSSPMRFSPRCMPKPGGGFLP